jgi:hypothetical protein
MKVWVPTYTKDGHRLIIPSKAFQATTKDDAGFIGLGSMLVECIILGMKFDGMDKVMEIDTEHFPHTKAYLGNVPVLIFEGPEFDKAVSGDE